MLGENGEGILIDWDQSVRVDNIQSFARRPGRTVSVYTHPSASSGLLKCMTGDLAICFKETARLQLST